MKWWRVLKRTFFPGNLSKTLRLELCSCSTTVLCLPTPSNYSRTEFVSSTNQLKMLPLQYNGVSLDGRTVVSPQGGNKASFCRAKCRILDKKGLFPSRAFSTTATSWWKTLIQVKSRVNIWRRLWLSIQFLILNRCTGFIGSSLRLSSRRLMKRSPSCRWADLLCRKTVVQPRVQIWTTNKQRWILTLY